MVITSSARNYLVQLLNTQNKALEDLNNQLSDILAQGDLRESAGLDLIKEQRKYMLEERTKVESLLRSTILGSCDNKPKIGSVVKTDKGVEFVITVFRNEAVKSEIGERFYLSYDLEFSKKILKARVGDSVDFGGQRYIINGIDNNVDLFVVEY